MLTRKNDQIYRFCAESALTLLTSPIIFNNILRAAPSLAYPILPLYYLADTAFYTFKKPEMVDHESNMTWTFTNRAMRNAKQFMWNVIPAFFYPGLVAAGGMPLAILLTALVVLGKSRVESTYESNEYRADKCEQADAGHLVFTPWNQ